MSALPLLIERLGLSDSEALEIFNLDPLSAISDEVAHRPELPILAALTDEALEKAGPDALRRWVRMAGADGRSPLELLRAGELGAFEDALAELGARGLIVRRRE